MATVNGSRAPEPAVAHRLLELYRGREDVFAEHSKDAGHYVPVRRALTLADLEAHVAGTTALGVYVIRSDDTVTFGSADLDNEENPDQARALAEQVRSQLLLMGIAKEATLLSFSGNKGYHVDLFVDQPVAPGIMRRLLAVAAYRAGVNCEVFPKQDTRHNEGKELGNLVKLPLAHHPKTGKVAEVLDRHRVKPESSALVYGLVAQLRDEVASAIKSAELPDPSDPRRRYGPGQREPRLVQLARGLNRHGVRPERILELALEENRERFDPPHPEQYVREKVADALKRYRADHGTAADAATLIHTADGEAENKQPSGEPYALPLDEFIACQLDTKPPLIGNEEDNILPAGGLLLLVAKGGRGKTTLTIDFALHAASGLTWLDFPIQRALRILLIENEGPREPFRRKLERKRKLWDRAMPGRVFIKTANWGAFTADDEAERAWLRAFIEQEQIDLVIGDPLGSLGVKGVGSPDDTREFRNLLVQIGLTRDVAFWLLHHPVKGEVEDELDQASGSWGGQMDTQFNLYALPGSRARLSFPKVRWGNVANRPAAILAFDSESEGFAVVDHEGEKERDLLAEIEELLADGEWRTPREISDSKEPPKTPRKWKPGIGADRTAIEKVLEEFPDLFSSCNGALIGRSPKATFYRCDPAPRTGVEGPNQSIQSSAGEGEKEGTGVLGAGYIETSTQNPVHSPAPVDRNQSLHSTPAPAAVIRQQGSGWEVLGPDHRQAASALTQDMAEDFCREQGWEWEVAWGSEKTDRCSCGGPPNHPWPGEPAHCSKCGLEVAS